MFILFDHFDQIRIQHHGLPIHPRQSNHTALSS
jgi:hypothetical protein